METYEAFRLDEQLLQIHSECSGEEVFESAGWRPKCGWVRIASRTSIGSYSRERHLRHGDPGTGRRALSVGSRCYLS